MVKVFFPYYFPSFHFLYFSLSFSPHFSFLLYFCLLLFFISDCLFIFFFSSFFFLDIVTFLEKKKITIEDFAENKDMEDV